MSKSDDVLNPAVQPFIPAPPMDKQGIDKYRQPGCGLIIMFIVVAWGIEIADKIFFFINFDALGLRPKSISGLLGIFTMPWLHGGFMHLISNTLTFIVLGYLVVATEKRRFYYTSFMIILLSGIGTWLIAQKGTVHVGASGLIYGYFGYLVTRAFLEKRMLWTVLGIGLLIIYGGMLWGMIPISAGKTISWEGHLCGFLAGLWMARKNFRESKVAQGQLIG